MSAAPFFTEDPMNKWIKRLRYPAFRKKVSHA